MQYDNTNTVVIFKNNKRTNDKAPEYTGKMNVDGVEKEVSLWVRESQNGNKFFSGTIRDPWKPDNQQQKPQQSRQAAPPLNDDVPFVNVRIIDPD